MLSKDDIISVGDMVYVHLLTAPAIRGRVEYIAQETGDSWIIRTSHIRDDIYYVQNFEYMKKISYQLPINP